MLLDKFLQLFVVKEKKFFPLFIQSAENIEKAAKLLVRLNNEEDPDHRDMLARRIKECETDGDKITNTIIAELLDSFVTPFDRDDIHDLAQAMDSVLDTIRDAAKKISIYQPSGVEPKLVEISEYIVKASQRFIAITKLFETMRSSYNEIDKLCNEVKEIEHIADDIYSSFMSSLFKNEKDAVELVKKKSIVQALEDTCDAAKAVTDVVRSILVKAS